MKQLFKRKKKTENHMIESQNTKKVRNEITCNHIAHSP